MERSSARGRTHWSMRRCKQSSDRKNAVHRRQYSGELDRRRLLENNSVSVRWLRGQRCPLALVTARPQMEDHASPGPLMSETTNGRNRGLTGQADEACIIISRLPCKCLIRAEVNNIDQCTFITMGILCDHLSVCF